MLETLQSLLTLISAYPFAAKLGMLASLSAFITIAVLAYPGEHAPQVQEDNFGKRLLACSSQADVQSLLRSNGIEFANHVQENGPRNDSLSYLFDFRCSDREYDALVYSYNEPANQSPHWLFLFDFYDPSDLDLDLVDADWKAVQSISFDSVKEALGTTRGFNAPLEIAGYLDNPSLPKLYRPSIVYVQVVARRERLNQKQLEALRSRQGDVSEQQEVFRTTATYDRLASGSLP